MPLRDVTGEGIERAREEFDRVGLDGMVAMYGGGPSTKWYLASGDKVYDLKLILRAAHQLQGLGPLSSGHGTFTSWQARKHLKKLGLQVVGQGRMGDVAGPLATKIVERLELHTVGFFRLSHQEPAELLGSGVLVTVGGTRAILTAHHVISKNIETLPETERLGLVLERSGLPQTFDTRDMVTCKIAYARKDSGPDLGALILAPSIANSIEFGSMKSFYNLDMRRDQLLNRPPSRKDGVWVAQGLVNDKTVKTSLSGGGVRVGFRGDGLIGRPDVAEEIDGYDYLEYLVDPLDSDGPSPESWGGMSGSGLWQIPIRLQENGLAFDSPLLSGICFVEKKVNGEMWIRCHGRKSVYEHAYNAIRNYGYGP